MDRFGEWRPIAPAGDDGDGDPPPAQPVKAAEAIDGPDPNALSMRVFGLLGAGVVAVVGAAIWMTTPANDSASRVDIKAAAGYFSIASPVSAAVAASPDGLVVDIEGAVADPGLHRLHSGSRVGDAIEAAGGYSMQVDIGAATTALNLAALLSDGQKIHVPARGESVPGSDATTSTGSGGSGSESININTASSDELDTLPGIGPVTAAKIIAAREQAPFATIDELSSRDVVGPSTLDKIRTLVTVGP
jgi:competence protein ComEA